MDVHRFADRAARAVYATIIGLAVILALEETGAGAGEVVAATVGGVIAAALAELYAAYIGAEIREQRSPSRGELLARGVDSALGTAAGLLPVVPFVLAEAGAIERATAYDVSPWLGVALLGGYTALANRLVGFTGVRNAVVTAFAVAIGMALIALKAIVH